MSLESSVYTLWLHDVCQITRANRLDRHFGIPYAMGSCVKLTLTNCFCLFRLLGGQKELFEWGAPEKRGMLPPPYRGLRPVIFCSVATTAPDGTLHDKIRRSPLVESSPTLHGHRFVPFTF